MKSTTAPARAKQNWTAFELLMLAPFGFLLWYVGTQPLVLPAPAVNPFVANEQVVAAPIAQADPDTPRFVTTGSTVLERIAPVARLTLEGQEAIAVSTEPAQVQVQDGPVVVEAAPIAPQDSASIRIEIADGTGVEGFAGELTSQLEKLGVTVSKTASMPAGAQRRTVILYRDGAEEVAQRLGKLFARPPALVNKPGSDNAAEVRLVLGSAAAHDKALLASKPQLAGM
ncbi:LytR C-terminal domain-containing protein [Noviherbaspirillum sp. ST9]|uniref:LytR C-terminal domain-containing protein n=1 Tax=Noviherbaspirillum sp. ST9 TaxID=3401606 RepID=UPI003B58A533